MTYKVSPTSLGLMKDCPRCFWLEVVKGIRRPEHIFPTLPNGMDRIVKQHFDSFRLTSILPPELAKENIPEQLYPDIVLLEKWRDARQGLQWQDERSGILLKGAVDDILMCQGKLIVLDFKTRGHPVREETPLYYQTQMDIYTFLLQKNGYPTQDYAYLLFYIPNQVHEGGKIHFDTHLVKLPVSVENAQHVFDKAVSIINGQEPRPAPTCGYCNSKHAMIS